MESTIVVLRGACASASGLAAASRHKTSELVTAPPGIIQIWFLGFAMMMMVVMMIMTRLEIYGIDVEDFTKSRFSGAHPFSCLPTLWQLQIRPLTANDP